MRSRAGAAVGSLVFLVLAPGTVAGYVPWWLSRWRPGPPLLGWPWLRPLGLALILLGLPVLLESFRRFAMEGIGTPAPILPTERLVVRGFYRNVRNPMYVAVTCLILGQGLFFGNVSVLVYGLVVLLAFHLFVIGYEEPRLRRRFGAEYEAYCAGVARWVPRLKPWRTVFEPRWRSEIVERLRSLGPDRPRRWGRMTAPQMVSHLSDQMRHTLGDSPCAPIRGRLRWAPVRYLSIYWVPWPRGRVKGPPEAFQTKPTTWEADVRGLEELLERFVARGPGGEWPEHALFGRMTGRDWGVFCYKHFDHHLTQFGA